MGITGLENQAVGEELARVRFLYSPPNYPKGSSLARTAVKSHSIERIELYGV